MSSNILGSASHQRAASAQLTAHHRLHNLLARPGKAFSRSDGSARPALEARCRSAVTNAQQAGATQASDAPAAPGPPPPKLTWMTCRRCKQRFAAEHNHHEACRYHSEGWTGGELAKATGFVRRSAAPEDQLAAVMGRTGLLRFWDCCGAEDEAAPGCNVSFHTSFDEDENERRGWR